MISSILDGYGFWKPKGVLSQIKVIYNVDYFIGQDLKTLKNRVLRTFKKNLVEGLILIIILIPILINITYIVNKTMFNFLIQDI